MSQENGGDHLYTRIYRLLVAGQYTEADQVLGLWERLVAAGSHGETIAVDDAADDLDRASAGATLTTIEVPVMYQENESLDHFLDRVMLQLYAQLLAKTGNHSKTARMLHTDRVSLYQRIERARRRLQLA